jgi:DNA-binding GntR family transcriptional regulator
MLRSMAQVTPAAPEVRGPASATTRRAYEAVRDGVIAGRLPPGTWLRESTLAEELGLSRTPVREALRVLAAEGVVELVHNRGARVVRWTAEDVEETYRLRALLEGEAAALAARRATPAQVDALAAAQDAYEAAVAAGAHPVEQAACNDAFHALVLAASGSSRLVGLHAVVTSAPLVARALSGYDDVDRQRSVLAHRDVLTGIRHRDEELAAAAMRSHILAARWSALRSADTSP